MKVNTFLSAVATSALIFGLAHGPLLAAEPHVHGTGTLQLVLEGGSFNAELRLPAINVVGFEHAPREKKHQEAVKKAAALLKDPRQVLALPDEARCVAAPAEVTSELLETGEHNPGDPKQEAEHDHAQGEPHADFEAAYRFDCSRPEALKKIQVLVLKKLSHLETLEVDIATPAGQGRQRLTPRQATVTLP